MTQCPKCKQKALYIDKRDANVCLTCDTWLDQTCGVTDNKERIECSYECWTRADKPSMDSIAGPAIIIAKHDREARMLRENNRVPMFMMDTEDFYAVISYLDRALDDPDPLLKDADIRFAKQRLLGPYKEWGED